MKTFEHLEEQYDSLNNELRVLFLQNIRESRFDDDTLMALNALTRELLRTKKMLAARTVKSPANIADLNFNILV